MVRLDAAEKATGLACYVDDFHRPGALTAKCFRSTIAHGRVKHIDVQAARAIAGVEAVLTYEDVPAIPFATAGHPFSLNPDQQDVADRRILTRDIRYYGDEIAVVAAENEAIAEKALEAIRVEYEVYETLLTPAAILGPGAREIHRGSKNIVGEHAFEYGGDYGAFQESDYLIEADYRTQLVQHCHLENHCVLAYMEDRERITIVTSTQIPQIVRRIVGQALDISWHRIRIIKPHVGGGFGNKQDAVLEPLAAFLTLKLGGRAVRISLSREECMGCTRNRHPFHIHIATGVKKDGTLTANRMSAVSITGAYASHGHSVASAGGAKASFLYPRAAMAYEGRTIYANMPVAGAMRAYGVPQTLYAMECNVEDAARQIGMDSVLFRLKNVAREGDLNPLSRLPLLSCGIEECLIKGREWIRWDEKKPDYAKNHKRGPIRKGLGVACFSYGSGTYPVCVEIAGARLVLNPDGFISLQVGAVEIGQGSDTIAVQMAAETIGVPCEQIQLSATHDTDVLPFDTGAYASRQAYVLSNALFRAGLDFKDKILNYAGLITRIPREELELEDGMVVHARDANRTLMSLADLAGDACYHKERGEQITTDISHKTTTNAPCFGCTFVDVTVDIPLCRVHINDIINVHDSGVIINPITAQGQVQGGIAMGIGAALFEELVVDDKTGVVYNRNFSEYKIPTALDVPNMGCEFVETFEPTSGYGNKALGEPPVISPPPAIRNAILDATGVAINEIPLTPQVLFKHFRLAGLVG